MEISVVTKEKLNVLLPNTLGTLYETLDSLDPSSKSMEGPFDDAMAKREVSLKNFRHFMRIV